MKKYILPAAFLFAIIQSAGTHSAFAAITDPTPSPSPSPTPTSSPSPRVSVSGHIATRFDFQKGGESQRIQDAVVLNFTIDTWKGIELVGLVENNPRYGLKFHTAYDLNKSGVNFDDENLYLKRLYLRKSVGDFSGEIGALGQMDAIGGHTTFGNNSWVDGGRFIVDTEDGVFSVTTGSLYDLDNPNILKRDRKLNYVEVYMRREIFEKILTEASFGRLDSSNFVRFAAERDFTIFTDRVITLLAEGLADKKDGEKSPQYSAAVGATTDLLGIFKPSSRGFATIGLQYSYGSPDIGLRGQVNDDRYMTGDNLNISTNVRFKRKSPLSLSTSIDIREDPRYQVGVKYNFGKKKKK